MAKGRKTGGRAPGQPNKVTKEFRETVAALLSDNAVNVAVWLDKVANGAGDVKPDPAKALDLIAKLAEYGAPKLNRTELSGGVTIRTLAEELAELNAQRDAEDGSSVA
jgi:hypothetical protein